MKDMDKNSNTRVVVTLTTIPVRLIEQIELGIKSCIDSLINQRYDNYEIHFNIPYKNILTNQEYIIPEWLTEIKKVQIFRTEDLGPATKLIPTVERVQEPDAIIIVVDDDIVYHTRMVKEQVYNQEKWKEEVIGYDGLRSRGDNGEHAHFFGDVRDYYYTSNYRDSKVDIIQHYKSVSYKRRYFEDDFFNFCKQYHSWSDDLLLSGYFSMKQRDRIATFHPSDKKFDTHDEWIREGGVVSFPVLRSTNHGSQEGCNIFRAQKIDDNGRELYRFIDNGYIKYKK